METKLCQHCNRYYWGRPKVDTCSHCGKRPPRLDMFRVTVVLVVVTSLISVVYVVSNL